VQDQLSAEQLQGALGEGAVFNPNAQGDLPTQIKVSSLLSFLVRNTIVRLQKKSSGQQTRRNTVTTVVRTVQLGKVFVTKEKSPDRHDRCTGDLLQTDRVEPIAFQAF
jgi:hypothetical protein